MESIKLWAVFVALAVNIILFFIILKNIEKNLKNQIHLINIIQTRYIGLLKDLSEIKIDIRDIEGNFCEVIDHIRTLEVEDYKSIDVDLKNFRNDLNKK